MNAGEQLQDTMKKHAKVSRKEKIGQMTLKEKVAFCSGEDAWHTKEYPKYGIGAVMMADGPHGLRKQVDAADMLGIHNSLPATCFPTAVTTACSWDEDLLNEVGEALGREAKVNGVSLLLGPGANIKRNPLCGRNFEYYSEDPYLTGKLAAAQIRGIQSTGTGACLKHFACNNQEYKRFSSDSILDERTMREIYLAGFETAVKEGKPASVMCGYNKINGEHCSDSKKLLTEILRKQWGFDGFVVTDWGAMSDRIKGFEAGCDLNMPGGCAYMEPECCVAVKDGALDEKTVDASVGRILSFVEAHQSVDTSTVDMEKQHAIARKAAAESAVLLKNEKRMLPLKETDRIVFIGSMAEKLRYQGAGSSHINAWKTVSVTEACPQIPYVPGCFENGDTDETLLREAAEAARQAERAVVFVGLTDSYESEGFDRENMKMPQGHVQLVETVASVNPNTIVVLICGSVVETSWADQVKSILYCGLPGQAGGEAICDLLFGRSVPCGKLAESWPEKYEDCISSSYYLNGQKDAHYREGLYVGYRYYTSADVKVRWPFGHGLSYTKFTYSDFFFEGNKVCCYVTNSGTTEGKEIVQLYVKVKRSTYHRPLQELKGFAKVTLAPGEYKKVSFEIDDRTFAVWDNGWVVPEGTYIIAIGRSSEDLPLEAEVEIHKSRKIEDDPGMPHNVYTEGDTPTSVPFWYLKPKGIPTQEDFEGLIGCKVVQKPLKKGCFTMENTVMEMKDHSIVMKILFFVIKRVLASGYGGKADESNPAFKMQLYSAADSSLSGIRHNVGTSSYLWEGLLLMGNGHFVKGIARMLSKKPDMPAESSSHR